MARLISTFLLLIFFHTLSFPADLRCNRGRGYLPFRHATEEGVLLNNNQADLLIDSVTIAPVQEAVISFRIDNRHAAPSRRYTFIDDEGKKSSRHNPPWGVMLTDSNGSHCWLTVSCDEKPDLISSNPVTRVCINGTQSTEITAESEADFGKLPFAGESLWRLRLENGFLRIIAGKNEMTEILKAPASISDIASLGFVVSAGGEILVSDISLVKAETPASLPLSRFEIKDLDKRLTSSTDPLEGYWEIFDRTLDESLLKPGGDYKLAIAGDGNRYEIIYLGGAEVCSPLWREGMVKGYLTKTSFPGLYNLEWIDAAGKRLSHSVTAQMEKGEMLNLQFPYHSSILRLRRVK